MAWEWVAPLITGVVGTAGTAGAVVIARIGRRHAEHVAQANSDASQRQAREARLAEHLLDAIQIIQGVTNSRIAPMITPSPVFDAVPSGSDERRLDAIVTLYCSVRLRVCYFEWAQAVQELRDRAWPDDQKQANVEQQAVLLRVVRSQRAFEELARAELTMSS